MAPSRDCAPRAGNHALLTIRRGHELIHVYDAGYAERILFPHESSDSPEAARADRQRHQREVHHQKPADRDTRISIAFGHNLLVPDHHEPPEVHLKSFVGTGSVPAGRRRLRREPS